jgi:hypothetical protein
MNNRKRPGDELPVELQAPFQYRQENSNSNPPSLLPLDHQTILPTQPPPVYGVSDAERFRLERDEYCSLYIDSNRDLNRAYQVINHMMHELNVQGPKIRDLEAELKVTNLRYEGKACFESFLFM